MKEEIKPLSSIQREVLNTLQGNFGDENIKATLKASENILIQNEVNNIRNFCINKSFDMVVKNELKKENLSLPYNLLVLQTSYSKLYNYKPDKTLEITSVNV